MAYAAPEPVVERVSGTTDETFAELRDVLGRVVAAQGGGGAALAVYRDGRPVVDLVAGDYAADSVQLVFSVTKAATAVAVAVAQAEGLLDIDEPLAGIWPEFDRASTRAITTRTVLGHRTGIPAVTAEESIEQLAAGADDALVARQEPFWEPGTCHGYHAFSYGTLIDGVFRRVLGTGVGDFFAERIAGPLGLDFWIGLPESERPRLAPVLRDRASLTERGAATAAAAAIPAGHIGRMARTFDVYNHELMTAASWPAVSGVAGARDLARLFAATMNPVDGVRVLDVDGLAALVRPSSVGLDAVLGIPIAFGSGVQLPFPQLPLLGPTSFGHEGAGGSVALADQETGLAIGFTTSVFPPLPGSGIGFDTLLATTRHLLAQH